MMKWFRIALINLLLAGLAGLTMRLAFVVELPIDYSHVKHAHSHLALLGWVYLVLFLLINLLFLPDELRRSTKYQFLFWGTELSAIGMFVSFPFQGYGAISMSFSLLHLLLTYCYIYFIWKDVPYNKEASVLLLRSALSWLFIASLGIWCIIPIVIAGLAHSLWYHMALQFFLHFQLSGWLTFAVLALFFRFIEKQQMQQYFPAFNIFYGLMMAATVLTYALAVAWASSHPITYIINGLGVIIQLGAVVPLFYFLYYYRSAIIQKFNYLASIFFYVALASFTLKLLMQSSAIVPEAAKMAHTINNLVIGFIHLTVLGFISSYALGTASLNNLFPLNLLSKWGTYIFLTGLISTEIILFLQGLFFWLSLGFLPSYYLSLFVASIFLPLGILLMLLSYSKRKSLR